MIAPGIKSFFGARVWAFLIRCVLVASVGLSISGCVTMYNGAHWLTIGASRLRSPIYIALPYGNSPLSPADYVSLHAPIDKNIENDSLIRDLKIDERVAASDSREIPLRFIALSGGGSRAAAFSAYVLQDVEELYNASPPTDERRDVHFFDTIDGFSTVSGGSVYAGYVAVTFGLNESGRDYLFSAVETARGLFYLRRVDFTGVRPLASTLRPEKTKTIGRSKIH